MSSSGKRELKTVADGGWTPQRRASHDAAQAAARAAGGAKRKGRGRGAGWSRAPRGCGGRSASRGRARNTNESQDREEGGNSADNSPGPHVRRVKPRGAPRSAPGMSGQDRDNAQKVKDECQRLMDMNTASESVGGEIIGNIVDVTIREHVFCPVCHQVHKQSFLYAFSAFLLAFSACVFCLRFLLAFSACVFIL
jgi:hypothetical protein